MSDQVLWENVRKVFDGKAPTKLVLALREYQGNPFLDLRVWTEIEGEWKPTQKGMALKKFELSRLATALGAAAERALGEEDPR